MGALCRKRCVPPSAAAKRRSRSGRRPCPHPRRPRCCCVCAPAASAAPTSTSTAGSCRCFRPSRRGTSSPERWWRPARASRGSRPAGAASWGRSAPGGLAEYVAAPAYTLYPLPDGMDFELAALVEPLAVVVHALHLVDLAFGDRVVVLGSGTIGVMTALAARAPGAAEVAVTYRSAHQPRAAPPP